MAADADELPRCYIAKDRTRIGQLIDALNRRFRLDHTADAPEVVCQGVGNALRSAARHWPACGVRAGGENQAVSSSAGPVERENRVCRRTGEQRPGAVA